MMPESENRPSETEATVWGLGPTIGFGLAIFVIYFVATLVVVIGFFVFQVAISPNIDLTQIARELTTNGLLISLSVIISGIAGTGFIILFIKFRKGISLSKYLGLRRTSWKTVLVLLGVFIGLFLLSLLLDMFIQAPQDAEFSTQAYASSVWPPLLWIAVVVFAPVFEEAFFRGFLFAGFSRSRLGPIGAIIITAVLWAALHTQYSPYGMITIFVLGLVFGTTRVITDSLWSTLFLHSLWNLAAIIGTALAGKIGS